MESAEKIKSLTEELRMVADKNIILKAENDNLKMRLQEVAHTPIPLTSEIHDSFPKKNFKICWLKLKVLQRTKGNFESRMSNWQRRL